MEKRKELTGRPAAVETLETRATREAYNAVVGARLRGSSGAGGRRNSDALMPLTEEENTIEFPTPGARAVYLRTPSRAPAPARESDATQPA